MDRIQQNGKDIVGHGWSYPLRINGRGGVACPHTITMLKNQSVLY